MSNVLIDRQKIDILANAISDKSGVPVTMTLDEMVEAVDGIEAGGGEPNLQAKTYTVDSAGTETITADSGYDGLSGVEVSVPSGSPDVIWSNRGFYTESNQRKWRVQPFCDFPDGEGYGWMGHNVTGDYLVCSAVPSNTYITPTESAQTIGGANYMMEDAVTVNAIPSNYVGSGITQRSSSDLTASGATVTVPSGYYSAQASKAVASGTAGTPTATKGTVSNHSISVTPSVTNTSGYIAGSTKTGTAVTVSASELVSGSDTVTTNDTYDVTNLAELVVNVSGGGASAWTKVAENTYQVTHTSTSTATVDTWATGHSELWTNEKWIYVRIRDTAGKRKGYFYGSDQFFMVYSTAATSTTVSGRFYIRTASTGNYGAGSASATTGYGVYVDTIYSDGSIRIRSRYSSSYSLTINGTYKVEVYLLEPTEPIFE